jgi:acyl-CoA synthetase (AMP-forming)/AMP-acid ligase II
VVCAVVVPADGGGRLDTDELLAWTEGRMAGFKRPRRIVVVDSLPTNASGKVDKAALRAEVGAATDPPALDPGRRGS